MATADVQNKLSGFFGTHVTAYEEEKRVIGAIIQYHLEEYGRVFNKDIILGLIAMMESTPEGIQAELLRSALEIVVARTHDDI